MKAKKRQLSDTHADTEFQETVLDSGEAVMMNERLRQWHPNHEEVERIVAELRPLIHQLARRDQQAMADEVRRREASRQHVGVA
jgi:hypothetical protein